MNKFLPGPEPTVTFTPVPRKHSSPLHKKFSKLERAFEKSEDKPLARARITKAAQATYNRILEKEKEEEYGKANQR